MKKFRYFFLALAALALAASCTQKEEPFEPGDPDVSGCYGVYFPVQEASGSHTFSPTQAPSLEVIVARTNTSGAITVPITATYSEDGIFSITPVSFADGQSETSFTVSFANVTDGKTYDASFQIDDNQYASLYSSNAIALDLSVMRVEMHTLKDEKGNDAVVTFNVGVEFLEDQGYEAPFTKTGKIQYYEVDGVRYCQTVTDDGKGIWDSGVEINFRWYPKVPYGEDGTYQGIEVPVQSTAYTIADDAWGGTDCPIDFMDYFNYYTVQNPQAALADYDFAGFVADYGDSYGCCYYDGHGGFYFGLIYFIQNSGGYWYGYCPETVVGIASGYLRVDYTFNVTTDYSVEGETPVYIEAGTDIKKVKYAVYEALKPAQIDAAYAAIAEGTDESSEFEDFVEEDGMLYGSFTVAPEKTGEYTIVLIALDDAGKVQNTASSTFRYISGDDAEEYDVDINVFTEATPERYRELTSLDSFAYGIYGSELTGVNMGIFSDATVKKYGLDYVKNVVKSDDEYAVSDEILAEINEDGGYYDVATGLKAETVYYVIVWATNGDLDEFAIATYETDPLPYVWNYLGKALYTDDVACGIYGIDPLTVEVDLYEEESHPGFFKMSGHQLPLISLIFEEDMTPYKDVYWMDEPLYIDATDPESVKIELQNYGVMLSSADGMIDGITNMYKGEPFSVGTYEDGVIAFPTPKGMLATIGGEGYYYANQHGAFKIVLPGEPTEETPSESAGRFDVKEANKTLAAPKFSFRYERDPKPVEVTTGAAPSRRAPVSAATIEKAPSKLF